MNPNLIKIVSFFFALLPWAVFSFQNFGRLQSPSSSFPAVLQRSPRALHLSATTGDDDDDGSVTRISIEYCTGCRWMLKSFWMAQELLTTFEDEIDAITIIPSSTKGIYSIQLSQANTLGPEISKRTSLWDRKEKGGFPSPKVLKQIVRDNVTPEKYLGHSDTKERQEEAEEGGNTATTSEVDGDEDKSVEANEQPGPWPWATTPTPAITITYCTGCKWLLRAAYFGQELLTTFGEEIKSVTLLPSKPPAKGGQFSVTLDGELIFDRATEGRFPEVKEIKQMIRDKVSPDKDLGHSDVAVAEIDDMN